MSISVTQVLRHNGIDPVKLYQGMEVGECKNFEMELKCPVVTPGRANPARPEEIPEDVVTWEPRTVRWKATRDQFFMRQENVSVSPVEVIDPATPRSTSSS